MARIAGAKALSSGNGDRLHKTRRGLQMKILNLLGASLDHLLVTQPSYSLTQKVKGLLLGLLGCGRDKTRQKILLW
jgi:hypothetical protein